MRIKTPEQIAGEDVAAVLHHGAFVRHTRAARVEAELAAAAMRGLRVRAGVISVALVAEGLGWRETEQADESAEEETVHVEPLETP